MKGTPLTDPMVDYMIDLFPAEDELLQELQREAEEAGIPGIQISPEQAAFMEVFVKAIGARRIVEVGTLAGYSAIVMGRALPEEGELVTIEVDPFRAEFARRWIDRAGLSNKVRVHVGPGIDVLERSLADAGPFDMAFIDADKPSYVRYVDLLLPLMRVGGVIAGDNALAWGKVADAETDDEDVRGIQAFNRHVAEHPRLEGAIAPIGDGMCIAVVKE